MAQIATGVYAFINRNELGQIVRGHVRNTIQQDYGVIQTQTTIFNTFQRQVRRLFFY